ncbi:MAG: hypothetical protein WCF61_05395 [Terriglobales bacterium]
MATQRWILFLLAAAMLSLFAGCGGSTANVQNPPPPPPPDVTVTVQTSTSSIPVSGTVTLTATITGPANIVSDGVVWQFSCQSAKGSACGTLSSPSSQSGASITFTAPPTLSANSMVTEIVAYAEGYQSSNYVAPITITTFDSSLQAGTYVLQAQGVDSSNNPYQIAAALVLDGQGNIRNGEQTANYLASGSLSDTNLTGTYFLGNDGRGLITLNTNDTNIGSNGIETFAFVFLNPQGSPQNPQALVTQVDLGSAATGASAVGTLDLQGTSVAAPSGSYAFVVKGTNVVESAPFALGGVLNIPSGQTAISGVTDEIIGEHLKLSDATFLTGSQLSSSPDSLGKVTFNLVGLLDGIQPKPVTAVFAGYIVDASHIDMIETDTAAGGTVTSLGLTGGLAIGQTAGSYGNFSNASFDGPYVFGVTGVDLSPVNSSYLPATWTTANLFTADGNGCQNDSCNGYADTFLQQNCVQSTCKKGAIPGAQISAQFTATYAVDSSTSSCGATSGTVVTGTGRACITPSSFTPAPDPSYEPELFIYLTTPSGAGEALVLGIGDIGPQPNLHYPSIGTGIAYPQSTMTPTFSGDYGLNFTQQNGTENDGTGQMNADSTGQTLSGFADSSTNSGLPSLPDQQFGGSFNSPSANAPFAGTLGNVNQSSAFTVVNTTTYAFSVDYYFIDPSHAFFIETDLVNPSPGSAQVSFGYYAVRTPLCTGCP